MEKIYFKIVELSKKLSLSLLLSVFSIIVGLLAWDDFRDWTVTKLGGQTNESYLALKNDLEEENLAKLEILEDDNKTLQKQLAEVRSGSTLHTTWKIQSFAQTDHLECTSKIVDIIKQSYGLKTERFSSNKTGPNYSGAFFSGQNGDEFVHGSFACTDYNISPGLKYTTTVLALATLSRDASNRLNKDVNDQIRVRVGPTVWPPEMISAFYEDN